MSDVRYVLKPHRSLLMVQEDPTPDRTDGGLFVPDQSMVPWTGVILDRGPWVGDDYSLGRRIMFRSRGGYLVGSEGVGTREGAVRFIDQSLVLGFIDGEETLSLPSAEWAERAVAPPGTLLVERVEMPIRRGRIILPDGARIHVRSNETLIRSIGTGVEGYSLGQRVLIAHSVGDELRFGDRGEIRLWKVHPDMILADVIEETPDLRVYGDDPLTDPGVVSDIVSSIDLDESMAYDEGDSRGPQ